MYEWNDKKSVMKHGKTLIRYGDVVPVDVMSRERVRQFLREKLIKKIVMPVEKEEPKKVDPAKYGKDEKPKPRGRKKKNVTREEYDAASPKG
jgi:hypothetical protein